MSEKSHVGMEQKVCHVCGTTYDTGAILLDKRLRNTLESKVVTGWGLCDECGVRIGDDFIALVEVIDPPQWARSQEMMKPEDANRTGKIAWLKRRAFRAIFNMADTGEEGKPLSMVFTQPGVIDHLEALEENRKQREDQNDEQGKHQEVDAVQVPDGAVDDTTTGSAA